ncbi:MAG: helix-turn-helix domain-containing protein [Candidatus Symbiothrix sp.]|nr:helix-turn-helix domain-containing protein [Candidatus Symbiothrix sp.]
MATLGTKLRNLREYQRMSQKEIADIIGVSQNAYNQWESDKCKPLVENLLKISQHYKVDIKELLDDNEKINLSGNTIKGENNIIANTIPTINIQSTVLIEKVLQMQEQISKLLESQFRLIEELLNKK